MAPSVPSIRRDGEHREEPGPTRGALTGTAESRSRGGATPGDRVHPEGQGPARSAGQDPRVRVGIPPHTRASKDVLPE